MISYNNDIVGKGMTRKIMCYLVGKDRGSGKTLNDEYVERFNSL